MVRSYRLVLLCATALILALFASCGGGGTETGTGSVFDQGDWVPEVQVQTVDHGYRIAGWGDLNLDPDPIFSLIASARTSLDIAVTRINRQEVVEALLAMAESGVNIRMVTEKAFYDDDTYKPFYNQLEDVTRNRGNLTIRTDEEGLPRIMGFRFMVIDHSRVITGSYNWETTDSDHTFGDVINILNTDIAAVFTNQFDQMFLEGNFGSDKRDETQHTFLVGSAFGIPGVENGTIEVYFGPNNSLITEIGNVLAYSNDVTFMVQQFSNQELFTFMRNWLYAPTGPKRMVGIINDIGVLGDRQENEVYNGLRDLMDPPADTDPPAEPLPDGVELYLNTYIDQNREYLEFDTMNHKLFYGNGGLGGPPTVVFSTANYSNLELVQNDEVILVFKGQPLVRKFFRGTNPLISMLPDDVDEANDIEEFDQVMAMYPYLRPADFDEDSPVFRVFSDFPCGVIFGTVANFREEVNMPVDDNQEIEKIKIDLTFSVKGDLFFGSSLAEAFNAGPDTLFPVFPEDTDNFMHLERFNPDHEFIMVVPAGDITLVTTVIDVGGDPNPRFEPDERTFTIAPGGVRKLKLSINQQSSDGNGGGSGGIGGN